MSTLAEMVAEVTLWCKEKGWYDGEQPSFMACMTLLHSEVSEAAEAWRRWGLADATHQCVPYDDGGSCTSPHSEKPEGIGSEFADILIRLLDDYGRFMVGVPAGLTLAGMRRQYGAPLLLEDTFLDDMARLHRDISHAVDTYTSGLKPQFSGTEFATILGRLLTCAQRYEVNLEAEYTRKMAYNRTREYRHGGKLA